jgi:hypothetical protein
MYLKTILFAELSYYKKSADLPVQHGIAHAAWVPTARLRAQPASMILVFPVMISILGNKYKAATSYSAEQKSPYVTTYKQVKQISE